MRVFIRNSLLTLAVILTAGVTLSCSSVGEDNGKVPVIVVSDLYFPGQDVGDNLDIINPYALERVDLKGVIFDVTQRFRREADVRAMRREPGFISIAQMNYIFGRNVPCASSPFEPMRSPEDKMEDYPAFQQEGFELLFRLLRESDRPVEVVSTGSCRLLAAAYNREPELMREKIANIHVNAGATTDEFMEWNIALDSLAAYRLLTSDLPIALYPCATGTGGPFDKGTNNTFWSLDSMDFIFEMNPMLRNYITFAFLHKNRTDYLNYLEEELPEEDSAAMRDYRIDRWYGSGGSHYVWEIQTWQQIAGLVLAKAEGIGWRLIPMDEVSDAHLVFDEGMVPVELSVERNGLFSFRPAEGDSNVRIYYRSDPELHQEALREAVPELYKNYLNN